MIAVAGLDMAAWDALARAANLPLCVLPGGSVGPVKAYNSNGLWLQPPEKLGAEAIALRDEGGFAGLKIRLGRNKPQDDLAANAERLEQSALQPEALAIYRIVVGEQHRFPTLSQVFIDKTRAWLEAAEQALALPDAWDGLAYYLDGSVSCRPMTADSTMSRPCT